MREDSESWLVQDQAANDQEAAAQQTASNTAGTVQALARTDCRDRGLAALGRAGLLQLSRNSGKFPSAPDVSSGSGARVAGGAQASQSTASPSVGAILLDPGSLSTPATDSASGTWSAV